MPQTKFRNWCKECSITVLGWNVFSLNVEMKLFVETLISLFFCSPLLFQESAIGRAFPIFVAGKQPFTYIDPIIKCTNSNNTMKCKKCMIVKASFINVKDIFNLFTYQIRQLALINHLPHSHYAGPCILVQGYFEVITFLSFGG